MLYVMEEAQSLSRRFIDAEVSRKERMSEADKTEKIKVWMSCGNAVNSSPSLLLPSLGGEVVVLCDFLDRPSRFDRFARLGRRPLWSGVVDVRFAEARSEPAASLLSGCVLALRSERLSMLGHSPATDRGLAFFQVGRTFKLGVYSDWGR